MRLSQCGTRVALSPVAASVYFSMKMTCRRTSNDEDDDFDLMIGRSEPPVHDLSQAFQALGAARLNSEGRPLIG
jgi:hypothetical protein